MATDKNLPARPMAHDIMAEEIRQRNIERGNRWRTAELGGDGLWYYVTYIGANEVSRKPYKFGGVGIGADVTVRPRGTHALKRRAEIAEEAGRQNNRNTPVQISWAEPRPRGGATP